MMTSLELAQLLKKEIQENSSKQNLDSIIQKLKNLNLTENQIKFIYNYCLSNGYDEKTKTFMLCESDNSEFLKYVNYVFERLRNEGTN